MRASGAPQRRIPLAPVAVGVVLFIGLIGGILYLRMPARTAPETGPASAEARAYVRNLVLSDVQMKATENFMQQQVVEIEGKIANEGPRALGAVDVYCIFGGTDGHEIYRERTRIVNAKPRPLQPKETRPFRLAFDQLPDSWNQAIPRLVIAQITFAS